MTKISLEDIRTPLTEHLQSIEELYAEYTKNSVELIRELAAYVQSSKGKQIRPILTLLCAGMYGQINSKTIRTALSLELLHTATLAHDDVVDNSPLRRHKDTINALWSNKIAILAGDFFITTLLNILISNKDIDILEEVSEAIKQIIEGEFLQQETTMRFDYSEENYFEVICKKTAVLIGACCKCGALSAGAGEKSANEMYQIGELLGLAFQIKDDILDYSPDLETGKLAGNDIKELKFTLPLIRYIQTIPETERELFLQELKNKNTNDAFINELINKVTLAGGIQYATTKMDEIYIVLKQKITEIQSSQFKDLFLQTIDYLSLRNT